MSYLTENYEANLYEQFNAKNIFSDGDLNRDSSLLNIQFSIQTLLIYTTNEKWHKFSY